MSNKLHLCCGNIYLKGYINCDITGFILNNNKSLAIRKEEILPLMISLENGNPNETDLEHYFKDPWEPNKNKRQCFKKPFILDKQFNILEKWPFDNESIEEIVMISCIEHFNPIEELPHILEEINRVMKIKGKLIIDFPDIKQQVLNYIDSDPEFCMELIYCNHKNKYSIHHWGFTDKTFPTYIGNNWLCERKDIVKHEYPMIGMVCIKTSN